jgi:hypothetical protein
MNYDSFYGSAGYISGIFWTRTSSTKYKTYDGRMGQLENKLLTIEYRRKIELFAATTIRQLIVLIYKRDLHCLRSVPSFHRRSYILLNLFSSRICLKYILLNHKRNHNNADVFCNTHGLNKILYWKESYNWHLRIHCWHNASGNGNYEICFIVVKFELL